MSLKFRTAVLLVNNIKSSREFYEGILDQTVEEDFGECVGYADGFSIWQMDYACKITPKGFSDHLSGNMNSRFELYFESSDMDNTLEKLKDMSVGFVHDLIEQPWGQRVFRIYDPDKNIVEIGEPMTAVIVRHLNQGMTPDKVAERTSMPLEFVQRVAEGKEKL